jgi:uncharacterized protein YijF (DUF1287 family)
LAGIQCRQRDELRSGDIITIRQAGGGGVTWRLKNCWELIGVLS